MTDNWDLTSDYSEWTRDPVMLQLICDAKSKKGQITFLGQYFQAPKNSEREAVAPIIVIQDSEEVKLLERGLLAGKMFEYSIEIGSIINGIITPERIDFQKRYLPEVLRSPMRFLINEGATTYTGAVKSPNGVYWGKWYFEFPNIPGNLKTNGRFSMNRVRDIEVVRGELEKSIADKKHLVKI